MKLYPETCETCKRVGGYVVTVVHDRPEGQRPRNERICGNCFADRLELESPVVYAAFVADLRRRDESALGQVVKGGIKC